MITDLITPKEVRKILALQPKGLRKLVNTRQLKAVRINLRTWRFRPEDVERFVERRTK